MHMSAETMFDSSAPTMKEIRRLGKLALEHTTLVAESGLQAFGVRRPSALLLLGHMRSGSTLVLHLLLTNPEVSALGERGTVYASQADLARLALTARLARGWPLRRLRYAADQVNHNQLTPNPSLLQDPRVRILFLLRRPQASLDSILELYRRHYQEPWSASRAVAYYVERLRTLMSLAESLPGSGCAALIPYESLIDSPGQLLEGLRRFLGLRHGFTQTYASYSFTGRSGDPGPNIIAGRIIRTPLATSTRVSGDELEQAQRAYAECRTVLERFALPL